MAVANNGLQIEWLIACLSPGDVAPHPNFRTDRAEGPALLALIVQYQWQEYSAFVDLSREDESNPGSNSHFLLDAARRSLDTQSSRDGLHDLVVIARDLRYTWGARAAAALLAAAVSSDYDEPESQLSLLDDLATAIAGSPAGGAASRDLAAAILLQQCAFRCFETNREAECRRYAYRVIALLEQVASAWDEFEVSPGISWSAAESQVRLVELIRGRARSLLSTTADSADKSWVDIVRSPFPAAAVHPVRDMLSALTGVMEETFKRSFSPRRVRFGYKSDSDIRLLYASLLNAELSGDLSGVTRVRQTFGNVLALALSNGTTHSGSNAEAIRLLRQGDAQDHLRSFLRELRAQGQLDIIRQSAEDLIAARSLQDFVTASDLVLLEHSADLVPLDFTSRALAMPFIYVQTSRDGRVAGSVVSRSGKIETTLKLLSTLTSGLEEVDMSYVAASTLNLVRDSIQLINQPLFTTIARLVQKIDWMTVPASTKSDWLVFLESAGFSSAQVLAIDRLRAFAALEVSPPKSVRKMLRGDEFVAALIEELLGDPPAQGDLEKAVEIVSAQVDEIQHDAEHGKVMGYIWSPFELAAFLIAKYSRDDMWATLLPGLEHPLVMAASKVDALRVLTNHAVRTTLPEDVREHLTRARLPTPPDMRQTRLYPVTAEQFEAACRNFYLAYGLIGPDHAQADVLRDAGSREIGARQEAALSCLQIAARNPDVEWSAILLLQLSHDYESGVRNRASYALAYLSLLPDVALIDKIKTRVRTLLAEPGIAIVSGVLRGLMDACEVYKPLPEHFWCRDIVGELAENHTSRFVQRTAKDILERAAGMRDSR